MTAAAALAAVISVSLTCGFATTPGDVGAVQHDLVADMNGNGNAQNLPPDLPGRQAIVNSPGWSNRLHAPGESNFSWKPINGRWLLNQIDYASGD